MAEVKMPSYVRIMSDVMDANIHLTRLDLRVRDIMRTSDDNEPSPKIARELKLQLIDVINKLTAVKDDLKLGE